MSTSGDIIKSSLRPTELCFDKNDFMKTSFSVDEFLHKNRNAASLELLRDNLGIYLKVLRSAMIDLINEDYADFVSLSANLVGLDESIGVIRRPLELFREDISSIKKLINDNEGEIREYLQQKAQLRQFKRNLQCLKKVYLATDKLEEILNNKLNSKDLKSTDLERSSLELIQLKFNMKFCEEYLKDEQKEKIATLNGEVLQKLRLMFNKALTSSSSISTDSLESCLRIYITLDACNIAEDVFKEDVVGPYMKNTISEHSLQNSPQGLAGIYIKILNFISLHMTDLLRITQYTDKMKGFNFLVNSFWKDVEFRLENHMSSIFAPGNSEVFFTKYKCTRDFLRKIEEILAHENAIYAFRHHPQTKSFQSRWNLPVYFQICFQEIAGSLESLLEPILSEDKFISNNSEFKLSPFSVGFNCIEKCWSDGVYLYEVFPKFYKLTIQIILRISKWISNALGLLAKKDFNLKTNKTNVLVMFHTDIVSFINKLPEISNLIAKNIPGKETENADVIRKSFEDVNITLENQLVLIEDAFTEIIIAESVENIRQVNDIPRLYRKTNREIPSRSSAYLEQMLKPIRTFEKSFKTQLNRDVLQKIMLKVFSTITERYHTTVLDVLASVQKTEESLRRLRNLKEKSNSTQTNSNDGVAVSDDDKIRLQLRVDVICWTNEIGKYNFEPSDIEKLLELNSFVDETVRSRDNMN